jgi:hypothetical protein
VGETDLQLDLDAVTAVVGALAPLDTERRSRVLRAVSTLLGDPLQPAPAAATAAAPRTETPTVLGVERTTPPLADGQVVRDVRSLKEQKAPRSANEMAAVVAYYLAEVVSPEQRTESVSSADMEKYFKQASYPLPKKLNMLLPNAAAAGYFDAVSRGQYKLNPVGHNLVAHTLPAGSASSSSPSRVRRPSTTRTKKTPAARQKGKARAQPARKPSPKPRTTKARRSV